MRRTLATAAALVALACGLAACDDGTGDIPPVEKTPEVSTGSKSPSATTSTAAATPDLEPVEVVKAWADAINSAIRTGDVQKGLSLATKDCQDCQNELQPIADFYASGGTISGGRVTIVNAKVLDSSADTATVAASVDKAGGATKTSAGARPASYEADKYIEEYTLRRSDDRWWIAKIVLLQ